MSDLTHRLETGPWKWAIYQATHPWTVLSEGEAENYESAYAAMMLKGLTKLKVGSRHYWQFEGIKAFIKFERVPDGLTVNDWGTHEYPFAPDPNLPGQ